MARRSNTRRSRAALRKLDTAPLQVLLEAAIAEVTLTNNLKYGVQYFYQPNSQTRSCCRNIAALPTSRSPSRLLLHVLERQQHQDHPRRALARDACRGRVVAAGDGAEQPARRCSRSATRCRSSTQQAVSTTTSDASPIINTIEYQDTGVILKVTPRVNQGGMVMMDISQEVSDVVEHIDLADGLADDPGTQDHSSVAVQDGETIALGGLIRDSRTPRAAAAFPTFSESRCSASCSAIKSNNFDAAPS